MEELFRPIGVRGDIVSVIRGASSWQSRLIVQEPAGAMLYRLSDPSLAANPALYRELYLLLQRVTRMGFSCEFGEVHSHGANLIWYKRPFYRALLESSPLSNLSDRQSIVRRVCQAVRELHDTQTVHGNICPSNIAFERGKVMLVDLGLKVSSPATKTHTWVVAPEIRMGFPASVPTDVFALAGVIRRFLQPGELSREQSLCLGKMEAEDPSSRPSVAWVTEVFGSESGTYKRSSSGSNGTWGTPRQSHASTSSGSPQSWSWVINIAGIVLFVAGGWYGLTVMQQSGFFRDKGRYRLDWRDRGSSSRFEVAQAAVWGDPDAQDVICQTAVDGLQIPSVNNRMLQAGCDPRWYSELSSDDKTLLHKLALQDMTGDLDIPSEFGADVHPGVIFGVLAGSPLNKTYSFLDSTGLLHMGKLPGDLGRSFQILAGLQLKSVNDPSVLAWTYIQTGQIGRAVFEQFLFEGGATDDVGLLTKIDMLFELFGDKTEILDGLYQIILVKKTKVSELLSWFQSGDLDLWKTISAKDKLALLIKGLPEGLSKPENIIELVLFPRKSIREEAASKISRLLVEGDSIPVLESFLLDGAQRLNRAQLVAIMMVFLSKENKNNLNYIRDWFKTEPDPEAVVQLIIARNGTLRGHDDLEVFEIEAAIYLSSKVGKFTLRPELIRQLVVHPEQQVRILAYQLLDPTVKAERDILETMADAEPNNRLKVFIRSRLESFGGL